MWADRPNIWNRSPTRLFFLDVVDCVVHDFDDLSLSVRLLRTRILTVKLFPGTRGKVSAEIITRHLQNHRSWCHRKGCLSHTCLHPAEAPCQVPFPADGVHTREVVDLLQSPHPHDSLLGIELREHFRTSRRTLPGIEKTKPSYVASDFSLVGRAGFIFLESHAVYTPSLSLCVPNFRRSKR